MVFIDSEKYVVAIGSVDAGDRGRLPSSEPECASTVAVPDGAPAGDALGTAGQFWQFPPRLPTASPALSSVRPKVVHRDFHSLCVLIVTDSAVLWLFTLTAPAV